MKKQPTIQIVLKISLKHIFSFNLLYHVIFLFLIIDNSYITVNPNSPIENNEEPPTYLPIYLPMYLLTYA